MKREFVKTMHFSIPELEMRLDIKESGINIGMPHTDGKKPFSQFNHNAVERFNINIDGLLEPNADGMVIPEGIKANKEDFLYVPFRMISATMVAAGTWRATMFPPRVLKKATDMLLGKGVFTNHNDRPENWTGYVAKTQWQAASKQDGEEIPSGINALLAIDITEERNRNVAKGIVNGAVYSNSVGIQFRYKMSHEFDDDYMFYERVGTMHDDGTMIHFIVTEVLDIHETSLVSLGADPYAKRIGNNGLINVDNGGTYSENAKESLKLAFKQATETKRFNISCGLNRNVLFLTGKQYSDTVIYEEDNDDIMNKKVELALLAKYGVTSLEDITLKMVEDFGKSQTMTLSKVKSMALELVQQKDASIEGVNVTKFLDTHVFVSKTEHDTLTKTIADFATKEARLVELEAEQASLKAAADIGESFLTSQRELAKKLYRLDKGTEAKEEVCTLFDKADLKTLESLIKEHGIIIGSEFSYSCSDCGSHEFTFGSHQSSNEPTDSDSTKFVTIDTVREDIFYNRLK